MLIADLHIHSRYSRATSRDCTPEHLDAWAARKGIGLVGTGDFTHPAWRQELRDKLVPAEDGLYRLRDDLRLADGEAPRFVLSAEISSIYKKNDRVRKVHNVILLPGLEEAERLSRRLEAIGNVHSDGRPILGLDSRDLLEITLEACPEAIFIPAHIWTPHFSLFGAFSGFDTMEECFEDLTPAIHAVETGLSSDPPMNWRLSALDRFTLVSNSDAHSPQKLGREANLLDIEPSFVSLSAAIAGGKQAGFAGTIEFFPEEGKYHLDGHRNCGLRLTPAQTEEYGGKCPVCGRKITIGVEHRVEELADREQGFRPEQAPGYESLVPLPEVIAASTGKSPTSKKVVALYEELLDSLGTEFSILRELPAEEIERAAGPCVAEGIRRLRSGRVEREAGYDGEYGVIHLLSADEMESLSGQVSLFPGLTAAARAASKVADSNKKKRTLERSAPETADQPAPSAAAESLNPQQRDAVTASEPVVAVIAGPGTGKTKTLVSRIAFLVEEQGVAPAKITAVTFTNQAAAEMRGRLEARLGKRAAKAMTIGTFHSICLRMLADLGKKPSLLGDAEAQRIAAGIMKQYGRKGHPRQFVGDISRVKCGFPLEQTGLTEEAYAAYLAAVDALGALDFDDLLTEGLRQWTEAPSPAWQNRFTHLLVDEFQDVNAMQYQLTLAFAEGGDSLFVIGDPDQSIYGFRGSSADCFGRLESEQAGCRVIRLQNNYRSAPEILRCALPVIARNPGGERMLEAQRAPGGRVRLMTAESGLSEGIFIAKEIGRLVGGVDMLAAQSMTQGRPSKGRRNPSKPQEDGPLVGGFSDIAVLYRTHRQAEVIEKCLRTEGIPYLVSGREDYLSDPSVQGAVAFLRLLHDPDDAMALEICLELAFACPPDLVRSVRGFWQGQTSGETAERLDALEREYAGVGYLAPLLNLWRHELPRASKETPVRLLEDWIAALDKESEPMARLRSAAAFSPDLSSFVQALTLGQEGDVTRSSGYGYTAGAVRLMTLHGAKGLEFPVVFLCGLQKGQLPLESPQHPCDLEEERRLFYVGMTRARDQLILLTGPEPSPFLEDVPPDGAERGVTNERKPYEGKQMSLF